MEPLQEARNPLLSKVPMSKFFPLKEYKWQITLGHIKAFNNH